MSELKPAVNSNDHHLGNINAAITLVEYGDFACPYCGRAHGLLTRLMKEKSDEVHFVFRHFPLKKIHPNAFPSAAFAEAAGKQGKFWEMHDLIFENQKKLGGDFLITLGEQLNLDIPKLVDDSKAPEIKTRIDRDFESGIRSGVNRTPTFFVNGSPVLNYDETYESLLNAIQAESATGRY